jgi:hypothetical protein
MGQLLEMPSLRDKERVAQLARVGATEESIAAELQIPVKRLKKRFRRELEQGQAQGKHQILENLYEAARSGSNNTVTTFWVKARCGWRDTGTSVETTQIVRPVLRLIQQPARS